MAQESIRPEQLKASNSPVDGYSPLYNNTTKNFTWTEISGVSSAGTVIKDDNVVVVSGVTILNFTGDLTVTNDGGNQVTISGTRRNIGALVTVSANSISSENSQDISFDTEVYDTDNMFGANPTILTIHTSGIYAISATVIFENNANGVRLMSIEKGGLVLAASSTNAIPIFSTDLSASAITNLAPNDTIVVNVYQDSPSTLSASCRFSAQLLT